MRSLTIAFLIMLASVATHAQTTPATTAPVNSNSIVFVNSDTLLNNYDYYKAVKAKMQDLSQKAQAEIATKGQAFQKEVAAYQKGVSSLNLVQRTATEKRLQKKQQDLQELSQNTAKQLQDEEAGQNAKLYDKLAAYLRIYAKQKG